MASTDVETNVVECPNCGRRNRVPTVADGVPQCGNCRTALPWIGVAGDDNFAEVVDRSSIPVVVDLWATWCGPCRMVSPALEQVARDLAGRIKLVKVDVDKAPAIAERFDVQAIPTLLVMKNGQVVATQLGAVPAHMLRAWVEEALAEVARSSSGT
ncbi:thioredoxin [Actinopolymorpha pittospori]